MSRITWRHIAGTIFGVVVVSVAIVAVALAVTGSHSKSDSINAGIDASMRSRAVAESRVFDQIDADNTAAANACEGLVRDQLKSPATAQFTVEPYGVGGPDNNLQGTVRGTVDSQNGFGALVRSDWICSIAAGSSTSHMKAAIVSLVQRN